MVQKAEVKNWHFEALAEGREEDIPEHVREKVKEIAALRAAYKARHGKAITPQAAGGEPADVRVVAFAESDEDELDSQGGE